MQANESAYENKEYKIVEGVVDAVNAENQTMSVLTRFGVLPDIPINNNVCLNGVGIRVMPIPKFTRVLLYNQGNSLYHLGSYYNTLGPGNKNLGLNSVTNNDDASKECAATSFLQRNLKAGEVDIYGMGSSEIFMPSNGDVLIVSSSLVGIELNAELQSMINTGDTIYNELAGGVIRYGQALRRSSGSAKQLQRYYKSNVGVAPESAINDYNAVTDAVYEFNVELGTTKGINTGTYDDTTELKTSRLSLSNVVLDNKGDIIEENSNPLYFLLDIYPSNVRLCSDFSGNFIFTSTDTLAPQQKITLSFGKTPIFTVQIKDTYVSIGSNNNFDIISTNYNLGIAANGDLHYNIGKNTSLLLKSDGSGKIEVKKDDEIQVSYSWNANAELSVYAKKGISLKSGEDDVQASLLGGSFVSMLATLFADLVNHNHAANGGSPATALAKYGTYTEDYLKQQLLSKKVKIN